MIILMSENNLITTKLAAKKLGVSVRRVQALITKGQLKAQKIGRDYMIDEADLSNLKKGTAGRPTKLPKDFEDLAWSAVGQDATRRTMRNYTFTQRAVVVLIDAGLEKYEFLFDAAKGGKRLGGSYKKTILGELGKIKDKEILLIAAKQICELKLKTTKAVEAIRDIRKKYGSFDEVYKMMPDGKLEIFSTDNE